MRELWKELKGSIDGKELMEMGEERIRLRMDFEKMGINGALGAIFIIILAGTITEQIPGPRWLGYLTAICSIFTLLIIWIKPSVELLKELADELDRRKK